MMDPMSDTEPEVDVVGAVGQLIRGCERHVVELVRGVRTDFGQRVAALDSLVDDVGTRLDCVERRTNDFKALEARIGALEERASRDQQTFTDGLASLKSTCLSKEEGLDACSRVCKCRKLFDGFSAVGQLVMTGRDIVICDTTPTLEDDVDVATDDVLPASAVSAAPPPPPPTTTTMATSTTTTTSEMPTTTPTPTRVTVPAPTTTAMPATTTTTTTTTKTVGEAVTVSDTSAAVRDAPLAPLFRRVSAATHVCLTDLPLELRSKVAAFHQPRSTYATKEKLTDLQRAYFLHCAEGLADRTPAAAVREIVRRGVTDRIWTVDFRPEGVEDFAAYLRQRIKNLQGRRRSRELKELVAEQEVRLDALRGMDN